MKNATPTFSILLTLLLIFSLGFHNKICAQTEADELEKDKRELQEKKPKHAEISFGEDLTIKKTTEIKVPEDYSSIQEAVDTAPEGTTILVTGENAESFLVLGQKNLKIKAHNTHITERFHPDLDLSAAFAISESQNITIEGFKITGGAYIAYSSGINIRNCDISGPGDGLSLLFSERNLFENNVLHQNVGDGEELGTGFYIYSSHDNEFNSNEIQNNEAHGIILYLSNNNFFNDNKIDQNIVGIELNSHCSGNSISNNEISNTKLWGIRLVDEANNNDLNNNIFSNTEGSGIIISRSENNCIKNGSINNSGYAGISILDKGSENNTIEEVSVTENFIGVELALGAKDSFFTNCEIMDNLVCDIRDFKKANTFTETKYKSMNCPN